MNRPARDSMRMLAFFGALLVIGIAVFGVAVSLLPLEIVTP